MFRFGQNWKAYALHAMSDDALQQAKQALIALLQTDDLSGRTFIDIGCGSGLHSVSAVILKSEHVYALDIDQDCIDVTQETIGRFLNHDHLSEKIQVECVSVLDPTIRERLPQADIVYSWGVLHHTNHMQDSIRAAAQLTKANGLFVIALYNKHATSPIWRNIKWYYNHSPSMVRRLMYWIFYVVIYTAKFTVTKQNPLRKDRGMDFGYDVIDWIGGYPYEYASIDEVKQMVIPLGFSVERIIPAEVGTGCNEFVFRKTT